MSQSGVDIILPEGVQDEIEEHCFSTTVNEVGGFLVGETRENTTLIAAAIPATSAVSSQVSLTFTHEVWDDVIGRVHRDYPGQSLVGWYHSHPGFGLFLSDYDAFIQQNFFGAPGQVALVVDPVEGSLGWFQWSREADSIEPLSQGTTQLKAVPKGVERGNPSAESSADEGTSPGRRALMLLAVIGLMLISLLAGWFLGSRQSDQDLSNLNSQLTELQTQLTQAQASASATPQVPATTAPPPSVAVAQLEYTVQPGDTLSRIAAGVYGSPDSVQRILQANPGMSPDDLAVGQQLTIPIAAR